MLCVMSKSEARKAGKHPVWQAFTTDDRLCHTAFSRLDFQPREAPEAPQLLHSRYTLTTLRIADCHAERSAPAHFFHRRRHAAPA